MNRRRLRRAERGFTLLEVVVSLLIVAFAIVGLHSSLGGAIDRAMNTKVNRQLRHLAQYQYGQLVVGKLHPEEQDPFLDGQTGDFTDVGGYADEYSRFSWELKVEEYAVTGASNLDLEEAGFTDDGTGSFSRPLTDDLVAATAPGGDGGGGGFGALMRGEAPRPEGQFRRRITLRVHWAAERAEDDRTLTLVTLVPVDGEGAGELPGGMGGLGENAGAGGDGSQNPLGGAGGSSGGADRTGGRTSGGGR